MNKFNKTNITFSIVHLCLTIYNFEDVDLNRVTHTQSCTQDLNQGRLFLKELIFCI